MTGLVLAVIFCIFMLSATVLAADNNSAADALPAADSAGVITLISDVTIDSGFPTSGTIDLNGYTLTYTGNTSITVGASDTLTITDSSSDGNGNLVLSPGITSTSCYIEAKGSLILQNITITSTGSVVLPKGDGTEDSPCKVLIESCNITTTGVYCVTTNATDDGNGKSLYSGVDITMKDSVITADAGDGDDCAVMMNVEGSLTIENSTITGSRQAVVVRAGTATITDSTLIVTGEHSQAAWTDSATWSIGNEVPSAALLVGNLGATSGAYYGDADVTVTDTTITSGNSQDIYQADSVAV